MQPYQKNDSLITVSPVDHVVVGATTDCISRLRFSPKECPITLLGSAAWDGSCSVWNVQADPSGQIVSTPTWTTTHDGPLLDMIFSPDGRAFFGGCSQTAAMWDLQGNTKSVVAQHDLPISCLSFVSAAQIGRDILITGSWDGKLRWWDLRSPNFIKEEDLGEPIFALDAQKSFPMMGAATGRTIHVYDLQSMNKIKELKPPDMMKFNLRSIACSTQCDGVAMGSSEGRFSYVPLSGETGKTCTFKAHMSNQIVGGTQVYVAHQVNFVARHPSLPVAFTGGGDGCISAFQIDAKSILKSSGIDCAVMHENLPVPISSGDLSADGSLLAYAHSYDWAMGKSGYQKQPTSIHIRCLFPGSNTRR